MSKKTNEGRDQPARKGDPVVDLRLKFGMEAIGYTERTCIIVVEIDKVLSSAEMSALDEAA